jgi:flavin-dependent dehydrogenase
MTGQTWDVLVAGGGPAGATAAAWLAASGRRVLLAERAAAPRQSVCGEFLSAAAAGELRRLGLDPLALGAMPVNRVRVTAARWEAAADLPFSAFGLARDALDGALLAVARASGAALRWRAPVNGLTMAADGAVAARIAGDTGVAARIAGDTGAGDTGAGDSGAGETVMAGTAVLATGKHDVRGFRRPGGRGNDLVGFKQHWILAPDEARRLDGHVELHLFPGGYAGLLPVGDGRANLCMLVARDMVARSDGDWPRLLGTVAAASPALARRLADGQACWPRPLAVAGLPFGFVFAGAMSGPHRVGDQLAVVHSFTGDGLALALESGRLAAMRIAAGRHLKPGSPAAGDRYAGPVARAQGVARLLRLPLAPELAVAVGQAVPALVSWLAGGTRAVRSHETGTEG